MKGSGGKGVLRGAGSERTGRHVENAKRKKIIVILLYGFQRNEDIQESCLL